MRAHVDGEAYFVVGSRGSGKSTWTMQRTRGARRLLVWDPLGQWSAAGLVTPARSIRELSELVVANIRNGGAAFRVGYVGPIAVADAKGRMHSLFLPFCRIAWAWLRARAGGVLVVEELADVTQPGKAPAAWGDIVRKSRHSHRSQLFALTQRPAESDKTIAGNCDVIHCGRLSLPRDRKTLAEYLDVPVGQVASLVGTQFIERDNRTGAVRRGAVRFS
jgi:hypothetical protein